MHAGSKGNEKEELSEEIMSWMDVDIHQVSQVHGGTLT